jgi:hypothetical protein
MKTIVIGDIHGRTIWKQIVIENPDFDKLVFIGDYFDSFDITFNKQLENFQDILQYKKDNLDKVVLLIGNHDFHYLNIAVDLNERYTGYQLASHFVINEVLEQAIKENLIQMCYIWDKNICSHAGITRTWCKWNLSKRKGSIIINKSLENEVNDKFKYQPKVFKFTMGSRYSNSGDDICQTPIWVRPVSLFRDGLRNCKQIVGHTQMEHLLLERNTVYTTKNDNVKIRNDMFLVDTLHCGEFLIVENKQFKIGHCNEK